MTQHMTSFLMRKQNSFAYTLLCICIVGAIITGGCHAEQDDYSEELTGVQSTATKALSAWKNSDWRSMYDTLSSSNKSSQTYEEFRRVRERLGQAQKLVSYSVDEINSVSNGTYEVAISLQFEENYNSGFKSDIEPRLTTTNAVWTVIAEKGLYSISFSEEAVVRPD